jgi:hypothetical protein
MKLTAKQLHKVIKEEAQDLAQAKKPVRTGQKNPATGFGMPKGVDVRFAHQLADVIAGSIDNHLTHQLESIVSAVSKAVSAELADEFGARPEKRQLMGLSGAQQVELEKLVVKYFNERYGIKDLVAEIVAEVMVNFDDVVGRH